MIKSRIYSSRTEEIIELKKEAGVVYPYPSSMLVSFESEMQHLACLVALLVHQLIANSQESRESGLDDAVKVRSVLALVGFVPESAADCEQALQTGQRRVRIVGV